MQHTRLFLRFFLILFVVSVLSTSLLMTNGRVLAHPIQSIPALTLPPTTTSDWNMFNLGHARFNANETTLSPSNVSKLKLAWSSASTDRNVFDTEIVTSQGYAYTYMPGDTLTAFATNTGAIMWQQTLPNGTLPRNGGPAVSNGIVYANDDEGTLWAFNAFTGAKIWNAAIASIYSVVIDQGIVYTQSGLGYPQGYGSIYALNAATGKVLWSFVTTNELDSISFAVANGAVYDSDADGYFYALNATTGKLLWSDSVGWNRPLRESAVDNGIVFVSSIGDGVIALDAKTGAQLWYTPANIYASALAVAYGLVYVVDANVGIVALNETTGARVWPTPNQQTIGGNISFSPAVANGVIYISNGAGVTTIDAKTGILLSTYVIPQAQGNLSALSSPIVANGMVFFLLNDDNLYALRLPSPRFTPSRA